MWLVPARPDSSKWITEEDLEAVRKSPRSPRSAEVREKLMDIFNDDDTEFWKEFQHKAELRCLYTGRTMEDALHNVGHLLFNTRQALAYQEAKTQPKAKQQAAGPTPVPYTEAEERNENSSLFSILSRGRTIASQAAPLQKGLDVDEGAVRSELNQYLQKQKKKSKGKDGAITDSSYNSDDDSTAVLTLADSVVSSSGRSVNKLKSGGETSWRSANKYAAEDESNSSLMSKIFKRRGSLV
jgi:hypothetical protein